MSGTDSTVHYHKKQKQKQNCMGFYENTEERVPVVKEVTLKNSVGAEFQGNPLVIETQDRKEQDAPRSSREGYYGGMIWQDAPGLILLNDSG